MSAQGKWIEQFGFSKAPSGPTAPTSEALFGVLTRGQLLESDYFPWAQTEFELPLVTSEFFAIPADPIFWDRVKDVHAWAPHLYPIADWDGVLLIACVEPPSSRLPIRVPHRFVLASARSLQMHWKNLNPATRSEVVTIVTNNVALDAAPAPAPMPAPAAVQASTPPPVDMPDGIQYASAATDAVNLEIPDGFSGPSGPKPASDVPDGFGFSASAIPALSEMPDGFSASAPAAESNPVVAPKSVIPAAPPVAFAPPPAPPPPHEPAPSEESNTGFTMTNTGFTITNSPDPDWVEIVDPKPLRDCQTLEELATHTLSAVARHFTGGLIFVAKSNGFEVWRFTAPFRTPRKPFGTLKLDQPSLFRIVDRTGLPYHGHISPAPENDRFFKAFLGGKAPAHVTLVPAHVNKQCVGMIMGVADSAIPFRHILPILETLAKDFGDAYKRLETKAKAAA